MATKTKNKFRVVAEQSSNIQTNSEFDTDTVRSEGSQPGEIIYSKKVNTGLRESTLIGTALIDALITDEDNELGPDSSLDDVTTFFINKLSNLSYIKKRTNITIDSATTTVLNWNKNYYVVKKTIEESSIFKFDDVNTQIYQSVQMMLSTTTINSIITIEGLNAYLCSHGSINVSQEENVFTFGDIGTYLITFTVKDSGTIYVEVVKGEYIATNYLNAPIINSFEANSVDGAYPQVKAIIANNNEVSVKLQALLNGSTLVDKGSISGNSTSTITFDNSSLYSGTFKAQITDTTSAYQGSPSVSKVWSTSYSVSVPTSSANGSDASTSRTITLASTEGKGAGSMTLFYKIWKSSDSEPTSYTEKAITSSDKTISQLFKNTAYTTTYVKVKMYNRLTVNGQTIDSSIIENSYTLAGKDMPQLKAPTFSSVTRNDGTCTKCYITVSNTNDVSVVVWFKFDSGSYTKQSTVVPANSTQSYTLDLSSTSSGIVYAYYTANNYTASDTTSTSYPSCSTCSCVSYTCSYTICTTTVSTCSSTVSKCTTTVSTCTDSTSKCTSDTSQCTTDNQQCSTDISKCSTVQSQCTSTVSQCSTVQSICTNSTSSCSTTADQCSDTTSKCSTVQSQCTSTVSQCSTVQSICTNSTSSCSTTADQCSDTTSKCSDTVSQCSSTVSQCSSTVSQCKTVQSRCTGIMSQCTSTAAKSACGQTECSGDLAYAPTCVDCSSSSSSSAITNTTSTNAVSDVQVDTTDTDLLELS